MAKRRLEQRRQDFKVKILEILGSDIKEDTVIEIKNCQSINAVRKVICELTEYHYRLRENGIKNIYPSQKRARPNLRGSQYDGTINSVRTISTPMGNKR
tara:strand:- start:2428 stop:2724 length:297 start_codon:yes stop_codon:yes gene_type:complete